jgi:hypothetical protein
VLSGELKGDKDRVVEFLLLAMIPYRSFNWRAFMLREKSAINPLSAMEATDWPLYLL